MKKEEHERKRKRERKEIKKKNEAGNKKFLPAYPDNLYTPHLASENNS